MNAGLRLVGIWEPGRLRKVARHDAPATVAIACAVTIARIAVVAATAATTGTNAAPSLDRLGRASACAANSRSWRSNASERAQRTRLWGTSGVETSVRCHVSKRERRMPMRRSSPGNVVGARCGTNGTILPARRTGPAGHRAHPVGQQRLLLANGRFHRGVRRVHCGVIEYPATRACKL